LGLGLLYGIIEDNMTDSENKSLNEIYRLISDFKADTKELIRDLKDDNRDLKEEIKDLKNEIEELSDLISSATEDDSPETMIDKAMALAERQPELASKLIDKFGDKIGVFIDSLSPNVLSGGE
jgi:cell division septum initiation protein DivIVA